MDEELDARLGDPAVLADHEKVRELSTQRAAIEPVALRYEKFKGAVREAEELEAALAGDDSELAEMAREELPRLKEEASGLIDELLEKYGNGKPRGRNGYRGKHPAGTRS